MVLVVIEATDVVFAVDSIPAVFGVTNNVFIVYTSNIFAVLGLRALCFLVASVVQRLQLPAAGARAGARVRRPEDAARPTATGSPTGSRWWWSAASSAAPPRLAADQPEEKRVLAARAKRATRHEKGAHRAATRATARQIRRWVRTGSASRSLSW